MSLSRLRTVTMVAVSFAWLDPTRLRPLIEGFSLGKARLPMLEQAHRGLTASVDTTSAIDAELARTPELAAKYAAARDQILLQGISVVRWTYAD